MREYKEEEYRTLFGVEKNTFNTMVNIIAEDYTKIHKKGAEKMDLRLKKKLK